MNKTGYTRWTACIIALSGALASCTVSNANDDDDFAFDDDAGADDDTADDDTADDDTTDAGADDDTADDDTADAGADDDTADDDTADDDTADDDTADDDTADDDTADDDTADDDTADDDADDDMTDAGADDDPTPDVTLIDCGDRDTDGATVIDSTISDDAEWSGLIYLDRRIDVQDGVTLTIAPGTRIIAAVDSDLEIGFAGGSTTIVAEGTEEEPISFCGEGDDSGFWEGIIVRSNTTSNSVMSHVLVADAGGNGTALTLEADITIDHVQVRNSGGNGVMAADFRDDSTTLSVMGAMDTAVVLTGSGAATSFPLGGLFEDNGKNRVAIDFSSISEDAIFHDVGIPYEQLGNLDVHDVSVTYEAGVEVQVAADADMEFGFAGNTTELLIEGTEADPVVFRGVAEDPGFWDGVIIRSNVLTSSTVEHWQIRHAGAADFALDIAAAITMNDVNLSDNAVGAFIDAQGLDASSTNLSITSTEGPPLTVAAEALITIPRGGDFTGNDEDHIAVEGGNFDVEGTIGNLGVPYQVESNIDVADGANITIEPGTHFVMTADTDIEFGFAGGEATIIADGTEEAPIRFTGSDESAGSWSGLLVRSNVTSNSLFNWVEIAHGGGDSGNGANLELQRALSVTNCTFSDSSGFGLIKLEDDTSDYTIDNTFMNNAAGDVGE